MAVELRPDHADAFTKLGHMLKEQGRISEAIDAYRKAIELRPDSPDWQHVLAALSGDTSPTATPASYVRKLFDPYADDFDAHLVEKLGYHVPEMMLEAVLSVAPGRKFDILDLGCGTGLCGAQFRPHANHLSGVDLSPAMLAKAAARGIYDRLITGDISEAMRDQEQCCDLLLAGDLFVYVGDLDGVLQSASRMLRSGGLLAFSLERHEGEGFVLHSKIRFAHSLAYIRGLAHAHRFSELIANEITVRNSGTAPVAGWLVVLQAK
jgi:predicted TPR repeat methyltransferase